MNKLETTSKIFGDIWIERLHANGGVIPRDRLTEMVWKHYRSAEDVIEEAQTRDFMEKLQKLADVSGGQLYELNISGV